MRLWSVRKEQHIPLSPYGVAVSALLSGDSCISVPPFLYFSYSYQVCFYKCVQPNASLRAFKKSIGIRTNEVRLYDIGISCIAPLSEFTHKHATHCGCTCSQTCCITILKLPKQQQLWSILRFHLFFEELPSGFCLQFHVRDAWRWNIFLLSIVAISKS